MDDINLCNEVLKELRNLEVKEDLVSRIQSNPTFIDAQSKSTVMQKSILSLLFYKLIMYSNLEVPKQIRLALNSSNDSIGWLDDIKLVIVPFIKINENTIL